MPPYTWCGFMNHKHPLMINLHAVPPLDFFSSDFPAHPYLVRYLNCCHWWYLIEILLAIARWYVVLLSKHLENIWAVENKTEGRNRQSTVYDSVLLSILHPCTCNCNCRIAFIGFRVQSPQSFTVCVYFNLEGACMTKPWIQKNHACIYMYACTCIYTKGSLHTSWSSHLLPFLSLWLLHV